MVLGTDSAGRLCENGRHPRGRRGRGRPALCLRQATPVQTHAGGSGRPAHQPRAGRAALHLLLRLFRRAGSAPDGGHGDARHAGRQSRLPAGRHHHRRQRQAGAHLGRRTIGNHPEFGSRQSSGSRARGQRQPNHAHHRCRRHAGSGSRGQTRRLVRHHRPAPEHYARLYPARLPRRARRFAQRRPRRGRGRANRAHLAGFNHRHPPTPARQTDNRHFARRQTASGSLAPRQP